jgi:hypothetical protein
MLVAARTARSAALRVRAAVHPAFCAGAQRFASSAAEISINPATTVRGVHAA